ncbi:Crp/Fnr family transcriptional regulator [Phyllobacterium brassicacearum]|uniref:Crp/Fnr family transcriptional regulator n=1 Tax=Phyllobacterium brassicacearum TaxID=314235 RepID=UPI0010E3F593|nr:Crp/Fnr family transcriptional regulator [Phyllobacterium brassicacearum]TDQ13487.1 CRP-like cAMP-binding protein [Phyllobacterium brassicacearum]
MSNKLIEQLRELPSTEASFGEGEVVFTQGSKVGSIYLVVHGSVRLLRHQSDGAAIVMQRAAAGSILAEASLFSDHYHCDAVALVPSRLLAIRKTALISQISSDVELAKEWNTYMAREIQNARRTAEIVSLRTVAARLDAWIAWNDGAFSSQRRMEGRSRRYRDQS